MSCVFPSSSLSPKLSSLAGRFLFILIGIKVESVEIKEGDEEIGNKWKIFEFRNQGNFAPGPTREKRENLCPWISFFSFTKSCKIPSHFIIFYPFYQSTLLNLLCNIITIVSSQSLSHREFLKLSCFHFLENFSRFVFFSYTGPFLFLSIDFLISARLCLSNLGYINPNMARVNKERFMKRIGKIYELWVSFHLNPKTEKQSIWFLE